MKLDWWVTSVFCICTLSSVCTSCLTQSSTNLLLLEWLIRGNNWQIKIKKFPKLVPSPRRGFYWQKCQQWSLIQAWADNGFGDPATRKIALWGVKNHWARSTAHHTDVLPPVVTQVTTDVYQLGSHLLQPCLSFSWACSCRLVSGRIHTDVLPAATVYNQRISTRLTTSCYIWMWMFCFLSTYSSKHIPHVGQFPDWQWIWVSIRCLCLLVTAELSLWSVSVHIWLTITMVQ